MKQPGVEFIRLKLTSVTTTAGRNELTLTRPKAYLTLLRENRTHVYSVTAHTRQNRVGSTFPLPGVLSVFSHYHARSP